MNYSRFICGLIVIATMMSFFAGTSRADDKQDAITQRMEQRYPDLLAAKATGRIGETMAGLVEAVDSKSLSDDKLKQLIDDENSDRTSLYELIAREEKTTPAIVADRAAKRNYDKAKTGDYLKDKDDAWYRKS